MFWGKGPDKSPSETTADKSTGSSTATDSYDADKLPASKSLPRKLQKIVDKEDRGSNPYDGLKP